MLGTHYARDTLCSCNSNAPTHILMQQTLVAYALWHASVHTHTADCSGICTVAWTCTYSCSKLHAVAYALWHAPAHTHAADCSGISTVTCTCTNSCSRPHAPTACMRIIWQHICLRSDGDPGSFSCQFGGVVIL